MIDTRIIAMYLPQYHQINENDNWWGEGYTDWVAVKNAKAQFKGHEQPRIPLNNNYYDLSNVDSIRVQAETAKKYGIYGFGIYHYWFSSKQILLDKPAFLLKDNNDIDIHYFFMWDNGSWKRTWSNVKFSNDWAPLYEKDGKSGPEILATLDYGDEEEWHKHFTYLLPFFQDERYIKIYGKPLFGIFNQNNGTNTLKKMFAYWNQKAIENGFSGIAVIGKTNISGEKCADYQFDYEPSTHGWVGKNVFQKVFFRTIDSIRVKLGILKKYSYKKIWNRINKDVSNDESYFPSAFVRYDDTPRRGHRGSIVIDDSPENFEKFFAKLLKESREKDKMYLFLTAWNEWGEGAYLEPDEENGYAYLEALNRAINKIKDKE